MAVLFKRGGMLSTCNLISRVAEERDFSSQVLLCPIMSWYFITSDGNVFHMPSIAGIKCFTAESKASGCGYLFNKV